MKPTVSKLSNREFRPPCRGMERALLVALAVAAFLMAGAVLIKSEGLKDSREPSWEQVQALQPKVTPAQDASGDYAKAQRSFSYLFDYERLLSQGEIWTLPLDDTVRSLMASMLESQSHILPLLYEAAAKPQCSPVLSRTEREYHLNSYFGRMQYLNRLLLVKALFEADRGNSDEAVKAVNASFAISRALAGQPSDWPGWREQVMANAASALAEILQSGIISPANYATLQRTLSQIERHESIHLLLSYEAFQRSLDLQWSLNDPFEGTFTVNSITEQWFGESDMHQREILWQADRVDEFARMALSEAVSESHGMDWGLKNISVLFPRRSTESQILNTQIRVTALAGVLQCVLAIEQFRVMRGQLPEKLDQLTQEFLPSVPVDPFVDAPVHYRRDPEGYRVYSVGDDFRDNRGDIDPNGAFRGQDIGVRIRYSGPQSETSSQSTEDKT